MIFNKKLTVIVLGVALSTSALANVATPLDDELGERSLDKIQVQLDSVLNEANKLQVLLAERRDQINYIKKTGAYQYFVVQPGSLRMQTEKLAAAAGIRKVRWNRDIPLTCDWRFDSTFKIDVASPLDAFEQFMTGLPLFPEYSPRDKSVEIKPLRLIEDCL